MTDETDGLKGTLAGRYRIDREIGRGGMATVYLARDLRHDSAVAVKVLRPDLANRLGGERFFREIRITAGLQHPNILPVFDSGESDGHSFYVMPYVEGETLEERLKRDGPLPVDDAVSIASEVAEALAYAHARGFVHRDIKPANILLSHGHALLADFGIARAADVAGGDRLTETGLAIGTAAYMSPEQAVGDPLDARSDIYGLGCVLYEMLAGTPPFTGTARAVMARHSADTVPSLRVVRDVVTPALEAAVFKAMAKTPADRHASAAEFKAALKEAIRAGAVAGAGPRGVRRGILAGAAVLVAVLLLVWRVFLPGADDLDANRVMVLPLIPPQGYQGSPTIGEDVATMIGHSVDDAEPLNWIDGWTLLEPEQRQNIRGLSIDRARQLARANRCAFIVWGRIGVRGDSVDVTLELHDVRTGDFTSEAGTWAVDQPWRAGLRAVNGLLPTLIPGSPDVEAEWKDRDPGAVASFLLAESEFRRIHLEQALDHYRNAIRADSTFALAAIRGAQAATWSHRPDEAESLIGVALRQPLAPRYASFATGYEAFLEGRADSAIASFRRAIQADPTMAAAWMQLGETYAHLLPEAGDPDSLTEVAFEAARQIDPKATNLLFHLIEIRLRQGDMERAAPLMAQFVEASPDSMLRAQIEIMAECVSNGPDALDWARPATERPLPLLAAAGSLAGGGSQISCSEAAYRALLRYDTAAAGEAAARRWPSLMGLQSILIARGRPGEAVGEVDEWLERWQLRRAEGLLLLDAGVVDSLVDRANAIARADAEATGPDYGGVTSTIRLWELGVWAARTGREDLASAVAARLEESEPGGRREDHLARSIRSHAAIARGDTAGALRMLDDLIPAPVPTFELKWFEEEPLGAERLLFARLLLADGQYERAIGVASVLDSAWPTIFPLYLRESLRLRIEAARAMRNPVRESQYRSRLQRLDAGDPSGYR